MTQQIETVPLYRIENPSIYKEPNGETSHEDIVGQWFSPDLDAALLYLRKSTQTFGREATIVDGAQLVIAHVPASKLDSMHVFKHPIAKGMDVESNNYIIPRDGSVETETIPLDDLLGELRGKLGNFRKYREASERVHAIVGGLAVKN